ncbi:phage major capsid protein [Microbispora bryophytorum]|uniref:phage major capsid protein n=1 Tax=Microbispora bryophytorum TaxID=1460882 RepID=UPI00340D6BBF
MPARTSAVIRSEINRLMAEQDEFNADHSEPITGADLKEWQERDDKISALTREYRTELRREFLAGEVRRRPGLTEHPDRHATSGGRGRAPRGTASRGHDLAMWRLDDLVNGRQLPARAAEKVERLITEGQKPDRDLATRWLMTAGDDAYTRAFMKLTTDPYRGHMLWTEEEADAFRQANEVRAALNLGNASAMVPLVIDPTVILTDDGSNNPLRRIARVVQTVSDSWNGVTSSGATAEWKAEGAEASDGTPNASAAPIPVYTGDVDVLYSYEVSMDAIDFVNQLSTIVRDAADQLMATAYTIGSGSGQPNGVVTALAGTSSTLSGTGTEALDKGDPFKLQNALPARFSARASFMSHIAIKNGYAQMETTNGALQFPELRDTPPMLLGKPWYENSNMDGTIVTSTTANNDVVIYGDFSQFVIVDRIGSTVEIIPATGPNRRPTGQRHMFLTFRTGSDVVVPEAFRMLNVATTA